jgi:hypothetical protein
MTPYSGTSYGERGGYANELLQNRAAYLAIKNLLNNDIYKYLLCSKNPASRLTAAEYFYSAEASGAERSPEIIAKINEIFAETPTITTLMGCMVTPADSRALVKELSMHKAQSIP